MKNLRRLSTLPSTLLVAGLMFAWPLRADAPALVPVQGYLLDAAGAPVDGNVNVRFRLYDTDQPGQPPATGELLHEETLNVQVDQGAFTAMLGTDKPLDLRLFADAPALYLGVRVGNDPDEARPLVPIGTTPFAAFAPFCGDAETIGGVAPETLATTDHVHSHDDVSGGTAVADAYAYTAPKIGHYQVPAAQFVPRLDPSSAAGWFVTPPGYGWMVDSGSGQRKQHLSAAVHLPNGAEIRALTCRYTDQAADSDVDYNAFLFRHPIGETTHADIASITGGLANHNNPNVVETSASDLDTTIATVDNTGYTYWLRVDFIDVYTGGGGAPAQPNGALHWYGCTIEYAIETLSAD